MDFFHPTALRDRSKMTEENGVNTCAITTMGIPDVWTKYPIGCAYPSVGYEYLNLKGCHRGTIPEVAACRHQDS